MMFAVGVLVHTCSNRFGSLQQLAALCSRGDPALRCCHLCAPYATLAPAAGDSPIASASSILTNSNGDPSG